ncbi:unnamed protein product [Lupinus luteus]|uniref:Uncharacterized protein n=1 Tax=Lupinus luteus TaxID=3873 RepID=A0AAV1YH98_LUPLU
MSRGIIGESLTVQSPGTQTHSFCYVSDLVDGLTLLMGGSDTGPIGLGNPGEFTMLELAETVKEMIAFGRPIGTHLNDVSRIIDACSN